jgi:hypothetical protein
MVIDYSIKAGRSEAEIDSAYLGQKQDASAWLNIKEGNTILEIYDPKDFSKLMSVQMGRLGLPKFFNLKIDSVNKNRSTFPTESFS